MRDFRDAKAMAHALRDALKSRAVETTHSDSLELIAKAFGYENWNILSAKIEAAEPRAGDERALAPAAPQDPAAPRTLYCSFCGKSQHDVRKLIAGPSVYICDECVELCLDIIRDDVLASLRFAHLNQKTKEELLALQQDAQRELKHYEDALRIGTTVLAERGQQVS